jgi:uncharacterized protein
MGVRSAAAISTEDKVGFLSAPEAYPAKPAEVEMRETHWSYVFLAGERAYKLKKPLASDHFDHTRIAAREANCRKEVLLNRRLAGDVYEGVARLVLAADNRLAIDGDGETIDWLVVMRRLPHDRMLDRMIAAGTFEIRHLERLGRRLATFYAGRPAAKMAPDTYLDRFRSDQADNRAVFAACRTVPPDRHARLLDRLAAALAEKGPLLEERARAGRIVDGHGDLRPQHVCMTETLVIFDCLEFSDALRQVDPVDEIAFLGMECAVLGADWIGPKLMEVVLARLGQTVPGELPALYTACRALLRARLTLAHLLDPVPREPERWPPVADRYADAADAALKKLGF